MGTEVKMCVDCDAVPAEGITVIKFGLGEYHECRPCSLNWQPNYEPKFTPYDQPPSPKVADFTGAIDGAGVKNVMTSPKTPLELIPPQYTEGVAEVLLHGAKKYAPGNWMRGMSWETVAGGMSRHLSAFRRGEETDPESGLPHLFHLACGAMFLSWYAHGPQAEQHRKFDDRKFKVSK